MVFRTVGRFKEIAVPSCVCWMAVCALVSSTHRAIAQDAGAAAKRPVLVLEAPGPNQRGLAAALRIQLMGSATVEERVVAADATLGERIERAAALANSAGAQVVVWSEPALTHRDGSREAVLYVVGQRDGRALLQVVRVPGGEGHELDRTLALKVSEILPELQRAGPAAPSGEALRAPSAPPAPRAAAPAPPERDDIAWGGFSSAGP